MNITGSQDQTKLMTAIPTQNIPKKVGKTLPKRDEEAMLPLNWEGAIGPVETPRLPGTMEVT